MVKPLMNKNEGINDKKLESETFSNLSNFLKKIKIKIKHKRDNVMLNK